MISVAFETTTSNQEILCDGPFEHNCDLTQALFAGKTEGAVYLVLDTQRRQDMRHNWITQVS